MNRTYKGMMAKLATWAFVGASALWIIYYYSWTIFSTSYDAREASLHPLIVINEISKQLSSAQPLTDWNVPLQSFLVWFLWIIGLLSVGNLTLLNSDLTSKSERFVLSFASGFTIYALAQLVIGLAGAPGFPLVGLFFTCFVCTLFSAKLRTQHFDLPCTLFKHYKALSFIGRLALMVFFILLSLPLLAALTPPVQSDGVRYHLGAIQEYLKLGRITYLPLNAYSNMPFLVEMNYLGALALKAPEATQMMHVTLALLSALGISCLAKRLAPLTAQQNYYAVASGILYLSIPASAILAAWPFTDHGITCLLIASILASITTVDSGKLSHAILSGLLVGGLLGTKYTMAPVGLAILAIPLTQRPRHFKYAVIATMVAAVAGSAWYLKNFYFTGNPFYPLGSSLFGGGEWTKETNKFLTERANEKGLGKGLGAFFSGPWQATFHWIKFEQHNPGPVIVFAIFGTVIGKVLHSGLRRDRNSLLVLAVALAGYVCWFYSYQSNRLLLPIVAVFLSVLPASLPDCRFVKSVMLSLLALTAFYGVMWSGQWALVATGLSPPPLVYLTGQIDKRDFSSRSLTYYKAYDYLSNKVRSNERVLLIGEHRIYGAAFNAVWSDWFDEPVLAYVLRTNHLKTTNELVLWLIKNNINWVLINERELAPQLADIFRPRLTAAEWQVFEELRTLRGPAIKTVQIPPGVTIHHLTEQVAR